MPSLLKCKLGVIGALWESPFPHTGPHNTHPVSLLEIKLHIIKLLQQ